MVTESSAGHLMPTNQGGNLSLYYDLTSVTARGNLDGLYGTADIFSRFFSVQWAGLLETAAALSPWGLLGPTMGGPNGALSHDAPAGAPAGALDALAARLSLSAYFAEALNFDLLLAWDPALLALEAFLVLVVAAPMGNTLVQRASLGGGAYQDFVAACKSAGLSVTEIGVGLTLAAGLLIFDIFLSLSEDDPTDTLGYGVLILVVATFALWALSVDVQAYYTLSCVGAGDLTARVVLMDALNNALCALRIFFCWVRYLFYDFQVEAVDLAFHYTDVANDLTPLTLLEGGAWWAPEPTEGGARPVWAASAPVWALVAPALDVAFTLLQLLLGLFKFAIALFLLWLLVDLFVLRPLALSETTGLLRRQSRA
jgi:hypothetical protein